MHHEEDKHFQQAFLEDVQRFTKEIKDIDNPFAELGDELITLNTHEVMPREVVQHLQNCDTIGSDSYDQYVNSLSM